MTQWHDPVVEEVRRIRDKQAAELNYDLAAIFERARRRQRQSKRKTVSFATATEADDCQEKQAALHEAQSDRKR